MDEMFNRIMSNSDVFYRHQKIDEEDLTEVEKLSILQSCMKKNAIVFLTRYGNYISPQDCDNFNDIDDSFVKLLLKQIRERKQPSMKEKRNRRFNVMQELIEEGEYFSDRKMRERSPYLFDAMIGRFLDEAQRIELRPTVERKEGESLWSTMLNRFEESGEIAERRNIQQKEWENENSDKLKTHSSRFIAHVSNKMNQDSSNSFEPEDEDDDVDEIEKMRKEMERLSQEKAEEFKELEEEDTPNALRLEFEKYMQLRFLAGEDKQFFDYSRCDNWEKNTKWRDPIKEKDDEERWFDEDD